MIYVSFPAHMTISWAQPLVGGAGGFASWSSGVDAVTSSTPMILLNKGGEATSYLQLLLGNVGDRCVLG